jgi:hypothetical protein
MSYKTNTIFLENQQHMKVTLFVQYVPPKFQLEEVEVPTPTLCHMSHIKSDRHKSRLKTVSNNEKLSVFKNACKEMKNKAINLALVEGTFAFHNIKHDFSFRSMVFTSNVMKKIHDKSFACEERKLKL